MLLHKFISYFSSDPKDYPLLKSKKIELKDYTPKELSKFNGVSDSKIYISVNRKIYDVTMSAGFYGPGSAYENFAGRDATRGLAKNSFDDELLTDVDLPIDPVDDLTAEGNCS